MNEIDQDRMNDRLDAIAHLAKCRFVVRTAKGVILDTATIEAGDTVIFDRSFYEGIDDTAVVEHGYHDTRVEGCPLCGRR